jgi:hypothetical protein
LAIALRVLVPILLLAIIAVGILYVRLLNGPISLKMMAQPIARAIAAEMPGTTVTVEDAMVSLAEGNLLEVQLHNVRFTDADGAPVAIAPHATVALSDRALWRAQIAPARIVLIEPRLLLTYSSDGGLSLSFARNLDERIPGGDTDPANRRAAPAAQMPTAAADPPPTRKIDLARTLAELSRDARSGYSAAHLKHLGLRNATLIIDNAGRHTASRITEAEFFLDHRRESSGMGGSFTLAMPEGTWRAHVQAESSISTGALEMRVTVRDLTPDWLAAMSPALAPLAGLRMPISANAELHLSPEGGLERMTATLDSAGGVFRPPWPGLADVSLDATKLDLVYSRESGTLELKPSMLKSGAGWMQLAGTFRLPSTTEPDAAVFALRSVAGELAAQDFKVPAAPLESLVFQGRYFTRARTVEIAEAHVVSGGAELGFSGRVSFQDEVAAVALDGRLGPMQADALKRIWPVALNPDARIWVGRNILSGRLVSGTFHVEEGGGTALRPLPSRTTATMEAADVRFQAVDGVAPVEAPRMLMRLEGTKLELSMPDSGLTTTGGRKVMFRQARMVSADVTSPLAMGDLTFRLQAPLAGIADIVEQHAKFHGRTQMLTLEGVDGRAEGQFQIGVPLGRGLAKWDVRVDGKGRVTEGRAKNVIANHDVQGATVNFEISDQLIDTKGDMLIAGVATRLTWQRIFAAQPDEQPPLRLSARLDAADRAQLGLDVNDLVQGETQVDLTVQARSGGAPPLVQLRADLTNAELQIESLAWRKPPGRSTYLEFELRPQKGRTELANFKLVGDDIALDGTMMLDQANKAREFNFPSLSLNVVSRLSAQGTLRQDNVWDVKVTGSTFVGRDFFRSLFSVGQLGDKPLPPRKDRAGLDLKAEIDTVLGFSDLSLKSLRMQLSKRQGKIVALTARGIVEGKGAPTVLEVGMPQTSNGPRKLVALSDDAGQVFRLVDFYPNMQGGKMRLEVNLDGRGPAEKTGVLQVERFGLLGDPVVYEVLRAPGEPNGGKMQRRVERPVLAFDRMTAPFSVGFGQFVIEDADLRGPVLGVLLKGKADFRNQTVDLGGTYIPLQGVNSIIGAFPILGQLLAGPRGEGVLGMTFAIQGSMAHPQVLVNPASMALPGILREMMQMTNPSPRVTPREEKSRAATPAVRNKAYTAPDAGRSASGGATPRVDPEGGWSQEVEVSPPTRNR